MKSKHIKRMDVVDYGKSNQMVGLLVALATGILLCFIVLQAIC